MIIGLYHFVLGVLFWVCFPILLAAVLVTGRHRKGLAERFGCYRQPTIARKGGPTVWLHAASVGEVKAGRTIMEHVGHRLPESRFVMTTMTLRGRDYARSFLPADIPCFLAPLDVPLIVGRAVARLRPDIYVCLETELWPVLITALHRKRIPLVLLNGRISDKSVATYRRFRFLFAGVVTCFSKIGVIGDVDAERFGALGARHGQVTVTGNVKHDIMLPPDPDTVRRAWQKTLGLDGRAGVFIAGSTHAPEESLLLPVYRSLQREYGQVWLLAPRHVERIPELETLLHDASVDFTRLSDLKNGAARNSSLVLVDTMGDLADIYAVSSSAFIGGSLADYGGHNVMEAATWENVVFFGPSMRDFQEAADRLERAGGGYRVNTAAELEQHLKRMIADPRALAEAGKSAGAVSRQQQGIARRQGELVIHALSGENETRTRSEGSE